VTYFFRARNAMYHLFRALAFQDNETVLVPDYHSGNEVWAIRAAGASIRYYHITCDLQPDLDELARLSRSGARALLVIHYLGWPQPMKELVSLCREHGMLLIEDCALSLLSETGGQPLGTFGDYAVFCLYKTLPIPNGGLLVQNSKVLDSLARIEWRSCGAASTLGRSAELMLEWIRSRADGAGQALFALKRTLGRTLTALGVARTPVGDIGFDRASVDVAMSGVCKMLLKQFDYDEIRRRRRDNFLLLRQKLDSAATVLCEQLDEGVCPLFFPLLVPNKRSAAEALRRRGIETVEFWNYGDSEAAGDAFRDAQFLRNHVLELPIHQDVTPEQVDYMAEQVRTLKLHL
jgi:dTDP-4-amino-4,6-dideoxygalactose transaminase